MLYALQQSPHHVRRNVAIGVSLGATFVMLMFWLSSLSVFEQGSILAPLDQGATIAHNTDNPNTNTRSVAKSGGNTDNTDASTLATAWQGVKGLTANVSRVYEALFSNSQTYTATPYLELEVVSPTSPR